MEPIIEEVSTGEVKTAGAGTMLVASALGSCIAVIAYDPYKHIGGIAHIMLPGNARKNNSCEKFRYAEDGIEELLRQMAAHGSDVSGISVIVAGGANVLHRHDDTICRMNIDSVMGILQRKNLSAIAQSLGGLTRRRIRLNITEGCVMCTLGDCMETVLWTSQLGTHD